MAQKKIKVELSQPEVDHLLKAIADVQYQHVLNSGNPVRQLSSVRSKIEKAVAGDDPDA